MKMNNQNWLLILAASVAVVITQPVFAKEKGNGFIFQSNYIDNSRYPICKELLEAVNLPENANAISERAKVKEIIFPAKYKNFTPVKWQPITQNEAKNLLPDGYLDKVIAAETKYAVNVNKDWDGKGDFIFEKTTIDFDGVPPSETMIRYRIPALGSWNCLFAKDAPNPTRDMFNPSEKSYLAAQGAGCQLFFYGKKTYFSSMSDIRYLDVYKPESVGYIDPTTGMPASQDSKNIKWTLVNTRICAIIKPKNEQESK